MYEMSDFMRDAMEREILKQQQAVMKTRTLKHQRAMTLLVADPQRGFRVQPAKFRRAMDLLAECDGLTLELQAIPARVADAWQQVVDEGYEDEEVAS